MIEGPEIKMYPLEGRSLAIFVVSTVSLSLSLISVCLRSFVRLKIVKAFGWDDALMVVAMVSMKYLCIRCFEF